MSVGIKDKIEIQTIGLNNVQAGDIYTDADKSIRIKTQNNDIPLIIENSTTSVFGVFTIGTSFPLSPTESDIFYNSTTKKLYRYNKTNWIEIDWQRLVNSGPEKRVNRIKIVSNQLQISPNGINRYDCIPVVGAKNIEITSFDNTSYSQLYYILPGTTIIVRNANHVPLVFCQSVMTRFNIEAQGTLQYEDNIGLRINNATVTGGDMQQLAGNGSSTGAARTTSLNIFPLCNNSNGTISENRFNGTINIINTDIIGFTLGLYFSTNGVCVHTTRAVMQPTDYWLGTWYTQAGTQFTVESLSIERVT